MKKPSTKKPAQLKTVKRPLSPLEELQKQSLVLSNFRPKLLALETTIPDVLEEIMKALAPIRYLQEASHQYQDEFDPLMVYGYLSLFLTHMDELLLFAEAVAKREEKKHHAA